MSRFYQRYLTQLKDAEKADDVPSTRPRTTTAPSSSSVKPDPTAMVKARPQSSRVSATNIQGAAGGPAVERRVQILINLKLMHLMQIQQVFKLMQKVNLVKSFYARH